VLQAAPAVLKMKEMREELAAEKEQAMLKAAKAKKVAAASVTTAALEKNAALKTKLEDQKKGDAVALLLGKDKEAFEALLANEWKQLMEGEKGRLHI